MSPFCGRLSGKPLLASILGSHGAETKAQGSRSNLIRGRDATAAAFCCGLVILVFVQNSRDLFCPGATA
jgi:hypothetical protein